MGVLNAIFLAAAAFLAVPLLLHAFRRHEGVRVTFPALRYLERTQRHHARRIRSRQLLLLLLRLGAVALLILAGARLYVRGAGPAHPPTALAIVLDNSLSSGAVVGEERVLDGLRRLALASLDRAGDEDRIWVIRAGEPWAPSLPTGREEARRLVVETAPTDGGADLGAAVARARELVSSAPLGHREIQLISDLQASGFPEATGSPAGDVPVVAWVPPGAPAPNRALGALVVGEGLAPVVGERAGLAVELAAWGDSAPAAMPLRLVVGGNVVGATAGSPGSVAVLPLPPAPEGWVLGHVETDPDALGADDRRFFAFPSRRAPTVAVAGEAGRFLSGALDVMAAGGRLRRVPLAEADVVFAPAGAGLDGAAGHAATVVLAPDDPVLLPAANRRLRDAGIPWTLEPREPGRTRTLEGATLPPGLAGTSVEAPFGLVATDGRDASGSVLAWAGGDPWLVVGTHASGGSYVLLASPLDPDFTSLPVSAGMIRFTDWLVTTRGRGATTSTAGTAGLPLAAPAGARTVRLPSGTELPVDGSRTVRTTSHAGHYTFLAGDSVVGHAAVNPPVAESDPGRLPPAALAGVIGGDVRTVSDAAAWERAVFTSRRGTEVAPALLGAALAILLAEAFLASGGSRAPRTGDSQRGRKGDHRDA